jgi:hypothetical protein
MRLDEQCCGTAAGIEYRMAAPHIREPDHRRSQRRVERPSDVPAHRVFEIDAGVRTRPHE